MKCIVIRDFLVQLIQIFIGFDVGENGLSDYAGSVQWVCRSPYRTEHRHKNWFIDLSACDTAETDKFDPEQVTFEMFRSGGKGGQNINKVETGVRGIYQPTGWAVGCIEKRSLYANRQKALARLETMARQENQRRKAEKNGGWQRHTKPVRGNAALWFEGMDFRTVKKA